MTEIEKCHCGQPLHYSSGNVENYVRMTIEKHGHYINVIHATTGKTYKVPRHYIALHGIKEENLHLYRFEEV